MASWKRARATERDAAVEIINAAYADGQITLSEHEDKVSRALAARTLGDVQQTVADLQGPDTAVEPRPADGGLRGWWGAWWGSRSRAGKAATAAALLVLAGGTVAAVQGVGSDDDYAVETTTRTTLTVGPRLVMDLVEDYEEQFGTTRTYGFIVMPEWTRVRVPTEDGRARYTEWTLEPSGLEQSGDPLGAGDHLEFDIAELDTVALADTIDRARSSLDVVDPESVTVEVTHPDTSEQPSVTVSVTNRFGESGYLVTDLVGTVVERSPYGAE